MIIHVAPRVDVRNNYFLNKGYSTYIKHSVNDKYIVKTKLLFGKK